MRKLIKIVGALTIGLTMLAGGTSLYSNRMLAEGKNSETRAVIRSIKPGRVSVTKYGAVGDGQHNDFDAFNAAINSGKGEIYIPAGTYDLGNNTLTVADGISLVGENQSESIIKNGCISSQYGISASNITFDGGATKTIPYTGGLPEEGKVIFLISPKGQQSVSYVNCTFENATVASFAREESGSFSNVEVAGCTFKNIRRVAVYHSLNTNNATFTNNDFAGLGGSDIKTGFVSAVWVGDITNNTYVQADNVVIQGNKSLKMIFRNQPMLLMRTL